MEARTLVSDSKQNSHYPYHIFLESVESNLNVVGALPAMACQVDINQRVSETAKIFDQNPTWPGVILISKGEFVGIVSRQHFFEALGKPFGIEIYSRKSVYELFRETGSAGSIFAADTPIQEAVKASLARSPAEIYDPLVIHFRDHEYKMVSMETLLSAQCDLLEKLLDEVQQLSIRDPLTNLSNRRGFFEAAQEEIIVSQSSQTELSALMIDIDNFKTTNDIYGHFVGDCVIRAIAEECQKGLRQTDLLGRFGGEEFIALLPNTPLDTACAVAERLRANVEKLKVFVEGYEVSATISIGVCDVKDAKGSLEGLITQADQAMYAAKWAGRNRVTVWDPLVTYKMRLDFINSGEGEAYSPRWPSFVTDDTERIIDETIEGWARALELRDKETEGHAQRVTSMTIELGRRIGVDEKDLVGVRRGALLHDIGKIAVPDQILFKPGQLTDEEWEIMRKHPASAFELLSPITYLQTALDIPYCHHEHWDGGGYPRGLKGEEIPLSARMFTIIDVWDALSSDRCYRPAWPADRVKKYILEESGRMFDPAIVAAFFAMLEDDSNGRE